MYYMREYQDLIIDIPHFDQCTWTIKKAFRPNNLNAFLYNHNLIN